MSTPEQDLDTEKSVPTRHSFRKDRAEQSINMQKFGGGQTTLNGKDAPLSINALQAGLNVEDNAPSVNASIFDSEFMRQYVEKELGGEQGVSEKYKALMSAQAQADDDPDSDLNEPLILMTPSSATQAAPASPHAPAAPSSSDQIESLEDFERYSSQFVPPSTRKNLPAIFEKIAEPAPRQRLVRTAETAMSSMSSGSFSPTSGRRYEHPLPFLQASSAANNCNDASCGAALSEGAKFCQECGKPQIGRHCTECGLKFHGTEKFCPMCGTGR